MKHATGIKSPRLSQLIEPSKVGVLLPLILNKRLLADRRRRFALIPFAACAMTILVCSAPARAEPGLRPLNTAVPRDDEGDTLVFGAYEFVRYDSNLFRLPDGVEPASGERRSAMTYTTSLGLHLDKSYGLQRLVVDASVTRDHYVPHDDLDFTGRQIDATYFWKVTPDVTGDIIFRDDRQPTDYEYIGFQVRPDPRKTRLSRLDVDWRAGSALHPRFSVFRQEDTSNSATLQLENSQSTSAEASLVYIFKSTNRAELYGRHGRGDSTTTFVTTSLFADRDFSENEYGVRGFWMLSGATGGTARIGRRAREYGTFSQRDFDGWVGSFNVFYTPTGKTKLIFAFDRNLYASQTNISSYYVNNRATASLEWTPTGKITVRPSYSVKAQDFRGAPISTQVNLRETTRYASLQMDWAVIRSVDLSFEVAKSSRASTISLLEFDDHAASVFARFKF